MAAEPAPDIVDVDEAGFERDVIERSREVPVVVDFWAPWCGPCRQLGPVLERLVQDEFAGRVVLARVNTDDNPDLSRQWGIRGIPAVKAFRDGRVVGEFVGAVPEEQAREFFRSLEPGPADRLVAEAEAREAAGDGDAALDLLRQAVAADRMHPKALYRLGLALEQRGDAGEALDCYQRVPGATPEEPDAARRAAALRLRIEAAGIGEEAALCARLERDPRDVEARYGLGLHHAARAEWSVALEHLLEAVRIDRRYRDDAARKAMLQVFEAAGTRSPLSDEYRKRLASALY